MRITVPIGRITVPIVRITVPIMRIRPAGRGRGPIRSSARVCAQTFRRIRPSFLVAPRGSRCTCDHVRCIVHVVCTSRCMLNGVRCNVHVAWCAVCCIGGILLVVKRQVRRRWSDAFEHSHHARTILWADRALQSHSRSLWETVPQQHSITVAGLLGSVSLQLLLAQ